MRSSKRSCSVCSRSPPGCPSSSPRPCWRAGCCVEKTLASGGHQPPDVIASLLEAKAIEMAAGAQIDPAVDQRWRRVDVFLEARLVQDLPLRLGTDDAELAALAHQIDLTVAADG